MTDVKNFTYPDVKMEVSDQSFTIRLLRPRDVDFLSTFLEGLGPGTRGFYILDGYGQDTAQEMCDAIGRYDKLRFVLEDEKKEIVGLIEFSLDILLKEKRRFKEYGITLSNETDIRFGPCLADRYQGRGVASALFPIILEIAKKLDKERIILWGGVMKENEKAIRFYQKVGFKKLGEYKSDDEYIAYDMIYTISQ